MGATYTVNCKLDENGWWVGEVPAVNGVLTQGRSLATIKRRVREALSLAVRDAHQAEITLRVKLPADVKGKISELSRARRQVEKAQARVGKLERDVARLLAKKMSLRDAGEVMSLTGQRVQQLAAGLERRSSARRT